MTSRFLHMADLHLTNNFPYSKINPKTELNERFEEQLGIVDFICEYAKKNKIKYIMIPGDIFHSNNPSSKIRVELAKRIAWNQDIQFFVASGNHDTCGRWHSLQDYGYLLRNDNFHFFHKYDTYDTGDLHITFLPWGESLADVKNTGRGRNVPHILLTHQSVEGAKYDNEYVVKNGPSIADLQKLDFDYVALGHFHRMQKLWDRGYFSGSIYQKDFKEMGQDKYFLDVTLESNKIDVKPIVCSPDKFVLVDSVMDGVKNKIVKLITEEYDVTDTIKELYSKGAQWVVVDYIRKEYKNKLEEGINLDLSVEGSIRSWLKENGVKDKLILPEALELVRVVDAVEREYETT